MTKEKITKEERTLIHKRLDVLEYFKDTNPYVVNQEKSYYKWYRSEVDTTPEEGNNIEAK